MHTKQQESDFELRLRARLPKSRIKAFTGHLTISFIIFVVLTVILYWYWFPGALFTVSGGVDGFKIIAGVDLVLGPALTLVIFNVAKRAKLILLDLVIIFIFQVSSLAAGVYIVYQERPVAVTYVYDRFVTLRKKDFEGEDANSDVVANLNFMTPKYFYLDWIKDPVEARQMAYVNFTVGVGDIDGRTSLYRDMPTTKEEAFKILRFGKDFDKKNECTEVGLLSVASEGTVCLDVENHTLRNFKPKSLPLL